MHSKVLKVEQSHPKHNCMEFDCDNHKDSYVISATFIADEDSKEESVGNESVMKATSPKPIPLKKKKWLCLENTIY